MHPTKGKKKIEIVTIQMVKEKNFYYENNIIRSPKDASDIFMKYLENVDREHFVVCGLNTKNKVMHLYTSHIGSLNASIVHPREVYKSAILSNCASIITGHNHPSGNPDPSSQDIEVTKRLKEAGKILGIDLLDHIIIGDHKFISLKEKGYIV